ncbi:hypothetical protein XENOCAPTIV_020518 [Xenoophorus captivus]|uniref:Uncharacterized protein n=1 Tax=Xenoophorus captivus TaxID=1517983 RepID=A0ABV0RUJ1_9TELE
MSAEASVGGRDADSVRSAAPQPACHRTDERRNPGLMGSKYVKLNVGGSLHYTTIQTLSKEDSLLRSICTGITAATIDSEGQFNNRVLFVKDVLGDEICCWSFYGEGRKIAEVCCTSIVYATEKKQTKVSIDVKCVGKQLAHCLALAEKCVEFPEARIFEETLNILIYENNRSGPGGFHLLDSRGSGSSLGAGQSEEEGAAGGDRRVRRIHVRRHIMHDERGHGQQTVYKD